MSTNPGIPSLRRRALALGFYLGLAPAGLACRSIRNDPYLKTHTRQALTLFAFLLIMCVVVAILVGVLSYGMVYHRALVEPLPTEAWLFSLWRKMLIVWGVFWTYGVWRALRGSRDAIPYLGFFATRRAFHGLGAFSVCASLVAVSLLTPLVWAADTLVSHDASQGRLFMVYEDLGRFPRRLFSFALYPVSRAAVRRWGAGSVVVLPMSREAIETALTHGIVVFVASHGTENGLLIKGGYFTPDDVPPLGDNTLLEFVYLAGCDSGAQRRAWERALQPATVKTYDRLTPVIEHVWWLWTEGPRLVRRLPETARPDAHTGPDYSPN